MGKFQPSEYSGTTDYEAMLREYAPLLRVGLEQVTDATRQQEVLRARIKNLRLMRKRAPSFLRGPFTSRIRIAKAKLKAAERKVGLQRETETAQRTYRALTQTAIVGGVVIAVALTALIVKKLRT